MVKGIFNAFDHMEFCSVIDLKMDGNQVVIRPPIFAARYVSFATDLYTRKQILATRKKF